MKPDRPLLCISGGPDNGKNEYCLDDIKYVFSM